MIFQGKNFLISTSQDGWINRWEMDSSWTTLIEKRRLHDGISCMVFTVSFVPSTGNKYFLAAADEHVRLFDFETCEMVQTFADIYSSYCDCGKFVKWIEAPEKDDFNQSMYFVTRGVELLDAEGNIISTRPNSCTLHKLVFPQNEKGLFELQEIKRFSDSDYLANSWLMKISSNGRYIAAPTIHGKVFIFHIATGKTIAVLEDHDSKFYFIVFYSCSVAE